MATWVHRCRTASERCGRHASATAAAAVGGDPAEGLAQHEVTGQEHVGVAQGSKGDQVGGPRPDTGQRQQPRPDPCVVRSSAVGCVPSADGAGDGDDGAGPGPGDADRALQAHRVERGERLG